MMPCSEGVLLRYSVVLDADYWMEGAIFTLLDHAAFPSLMSDLRLPRFWGPQAAQTPLFRSIGGKARGVTFHSHKAAWCVVMEGAKLWQFLAPTPQRYVSLQPLLELEREVLYDIEQTADEKLAIRCAASRRTSLPPIECEQRRGDLLYLPPGFVHQTSNLEEGTVAMAAMPKHPSLWPTAPSENVPELNGCLPPGNCHGFCCEVVECEAPLKDRSRVHTENVAAKECMARANRAEEIELIQRDAQSQR